MWKDMECEWVGKWQLLLLWRHETCNEFYETLYMKGNKDIVLFQKIKKDVYVDYSIYSLGAAWNCSYEHYKLNGVW